MGKETKSNKKGNKLIIIIAALLIVGIGAFAGVYFALSNSGQAVEKPIVEAYWELGEIMVNLNDNSGKKYAKVTASVSYDSANSDLTEELTTKSVALRDVAIFYFKSLKSEDFSPDNEVNLKKNLVEKLNYELKSGLILDVMFNELLIQ